MCQLHSSQQAPLSNGGVALEILKAQNRSCDTPQDQPEAGKVTPIPPSQGPRDPSPLVTQEDLSANVLLLRIDFYKSAHQTTPIGYSKLFFKKTTSAVKVKSLNYTCQVFQGLM